MWSWISRNQGGVSLLGFFRCEKQFFCKVLTSINKRANINISDTLVSRSLYINNLALLAQCKSYLFCMRYE